MKVSAATYQAVSLLHGGPNTQLRNTLKHLEAFGVQGSLFDPWAKFDKDTCDLFHFFAANIGTYHLAREVHGLGVPLIVSPIVYSLHPARFIRRVLVATRLMQRVGKGLWSDYVFTSDMCSWAAVVLPNSEAEADLVVEGFEVPRSKVRVVPNGVDERFYHADPSLFKEKYGLEKFILNVGHVGPERKNALSLIQALGQIDHPAVIVGRIIAGPYGDACVREAAKHKHILLLDRLDNNSDILASAYAACDVFVLPSLFETPGIAALEAGLAGAKVVITPHGGPKEYFGDMARYVDPQSVGSIRDGIIAALQAPRNPLLREHIRRSFLWQHVAEKTAAAYREALAGGR